MHCDFVSLAGKIGGEENAKIIIKVVWINNWLNISLLLF